VIRSDSYLVAIFFLARILSGSLCYEVYTPGSSPGRVKRVFVFFFKRPRLVLGPIQPTVKWLPAFFLGIKRMKLATHLYLVKSLRMRGDIPLLPLYDFMAWAGTNLTLCYYIYFDSTNIVFNLL